MATSGANKGNVYSSLNLSEYMCSSLPKEASPHLRNPYDAVALLSHACMLAVGFIAVGLGEEHRIEATADASSPQPLPLEWNATSTSYYAFRYSHPQSSMQYIIKVSRLGPKAVINGMGIGDDKVHALNITTSEFLSESSFPFTVSSDDDTTRTARRIQDLFISEGRLTDLGNLFKIQIVQKLAPGLRKEGYEDSAHAASHNESSQPHDQGRMQQPEREEGRPRPAHDPLRDDHLPPPARPYPFDDPLAAGPRRPFPTGEFPPPGFEDEYEINRPRGYGGIGGARRPLNIGEQDLYPPGLGPHDPLGRGGMGSVGGGGGGGMHPTFDDPMFGGGGGGGGVGGYDPRAPPGARYDPIGPGDRPPNLRHGPRFPGRGGGPPNPFGGFGSGDFI